MQERAEKSFLKQRSSMITCMSCNSTSRQEKASGVLWVNQIVVVGWVENKYVIVYLILIALGI